MKWFIVREKSIDPWGQMPNLNRIKEKSPEPNGPGLGKCHWYNAFTQQRRPLRIPQHLRQLDPQQLRLRQAPLQPPQLLQYEPWQQ